MTAFGRSRALFDRGATLLRSHPYWLSAAIAALVWAASCIALQGAPSQAPSWSGWFDQDHYVTSARALARGDLAASAHWYPLGYALIAAPFVWLLPANPYFLADLLLFAVTCIGFQRAARAFGVSEGPALIIFLLCTLAAKPVAPLWVIPWTTTLSAALMCWLFARVLDALPPSTCTAPAPASMATLGLLAGVLPVVRPSDLIVAAMALIVLLCGLWRQRRLRLASLAWLAAGGLISWAIGLSLHLAIHGAQASDYMRAGAAQGFAFHDLPWKAYVILITAQPWYPASPSMIEALPWLVPGAAGLLVLGWTRAPSRLALVLLAAMGLPYAALFLAYTDLQPPGLWRFHNAHYFKWLLPFAGLGTWIWLRNLLSRRHRQISIAMLVLAVLPGCFRLLPAPVPNTHSARMLLFRGETARDWNEAYFAATIITDDRGALNNVGRFHQIPDAHGARAIAVVRPFAANPMRADPGESPIYRGSQAPYARYDTRISFGLPCWIDRSGCTLILPNRLEIAEPPPIAP